MTKQNFSEIWAMLKSPDEESRNLGISLILSDDLFCFANHIQDIRVEPGYAFDGQFVKHKAYFPYVKYDTSLVYYEPMRPSTLILEGV